MVIVTVKQGHYGKPIRLNIRRAGALVDLTGYAVVWKIWAKGESTVKWSITGSIAETGKVDFTPANTHFTEEGTFEAELEWTKESIVDGSDMFEVKVERSR